MTKACPETSAITAYSFKLDGKKVHLIDTPGFDDIRRSDVDVFKELAFWLSEAYQQNVKLDSILYLHRISDRRMAGSRMKDLRFLKKLCKLGSFSSVALVSTMWDAVNLEVAVKREAQLIFHPDFWGFLRKQGSRHYRHSGTPESAFQIIIAVTRTDTKNILQIQRELVNEHKSLAETSAGGGFETELEIAKKKHEEVIRVLQAEMNQAIAENDETTTSFIYKEVRDYEEKINNLEKDRLVLQRSQATKYLSEKEMKELEAKRPQDIVRLSAYLSKGIDLEKAIEELDARGRQDILRLEADLLAETNRETKGRLERERLPEQLNPQLLLQAKPAQLGVTVGEYQAESPPPYASEKSSEYEDLQQAPENNDSPEPGYTQTTLSSTREGTVKHRELARPRSSKLKQILAFWKKFRRPGIPENYRRVEWICVSTSWEVARLTL